MVMSTEKKTHYTVSDAAEQFGKTTARIRQLCISQGIGKLIERRVRLLSERDLKRLAKYFDQFGKNFSDRD